VLHIYIYIYDISNLRVKWRCSIGVMIDRERQK